jgi:hypothetical protein
MNEYFHQPKHKDVYHSKYACVGCENHPLSKLQTLNWERGRLSSKLMKSHEED